MGPGLLVLLVAAGIWHGSASPTIEPNVPTVTVNNGDLVNFLCYGDSSVEWITKEKNKVVHTMGTNSTLTIASATYKDTGTYQCAYTNSSDRGRASVHLFVRDPTNVWYVSTYRVQVKEGSDAQLPCLITNPAYGSNVTLLMDNHSPILPGTEFSFSAQDGVTIYRVQQAQKGYYRCQVLINGEAKKSARIRLLVSEVEASVSVTMDTKDHVRIQGEPFWVTCQVKAPSHKYDIAWKHPAEKAAITKTTDYVKKDYIINVTLTIAAVTIGDSGRYTCMANNSGGSRSLSTMLKVIERGYVHLSPVQNTTQNIALGGSLQLQVQIEAYPPLHDWGWKHHNPSEDFENSQLENQMATGNNRYTNTLVLSRLQRVESGFYTFYAANREDTASMTFSLFLKSPPRMNIVPTNNSKTLRCLADGYPAPHVEWYQCYKHAERYNPNCTLILNDTRPQVLEKMLFKTVQVESILTVPKMSANLTFCCVAVNEEGNTSETFHPYITREVWMAPNKLFNPTLYSCVGISILLLLLLLFLLYKYKQVRLSPRGRGVCSKQRPACRGLLPLCSAANTGPVAVRQACTSLNTFGGAKLVPRLQLLGLGSPAGLAREIWKCPLAGEEASLFHAANFVNLKPCTWLMLGVMPAENKGGHESSRKQLPHSYGGRLSCPSRMGRRGAHESSCPCLLPTTTFSVGKYWTPQPQLTPFLPGTTWSQYCAGFSSKCSAKVLAHIFLNQLFFARISTNVQI